MSLLYKSNNFTLIDHRDFIIKLYRNVFDNDDISTYELTKNLFSIQNTKREGNRKRTYDTTDLQEFQEDTKKVQKMYAQFLIEVPTQLKTRVHSQCTSMATADVRDLSKKLFESTVFGHGGISGGNNSDTPFNRKVNDEYFLIPENSRFYCGCVKDQCKKLEGSQFDILIADPPWWNKYIRRLKGANDKLGYSMMYNDDIAALPVQNLLSPNCLVAVWCTNSPSNIKAVKDTILPQWGVTYVTTWYWLKVTVELEPLRQFRSGYKKQPYERLILGKVGNVEVPEDQLIVSVPSALHSHKPPLLDLLTPYVKKENPQILELFARYLLPNTTSVGFEPLKWQHISLYESVT